jgi:sulfur carrier protein
MKLKVVVNGENREVEPGTTVLGLLQALQIGSGPVAVEVNSSVVRQAQHGDYRLSSGDRIEIVTLVGGGS